MAQKVFQDYSELKFSKIDNEEFSKLNERVKPEIRSLINGLEQEAYQWCYKLASGFTVKSTDLKELDSLCDKLEKELDC